MHSMIKLMCIQHIIYIQDGIIINILSEEFWHIIYIQDGINILSEEFRHILYVVAGHVINRQLFGVSWLLHD